MSVPLINDKVRSDGRYEDRKWKERRQRDGYREKEPGFTGVYGA